MSEILKTKIGLEIHVQLKTKSKMFCGCDNEAQGKKPNEEICPICLGMPGTLPVPNIEAVKETIKLGLALNCEIAKVSKFDRKHYFYPDLPKGYQISQYDMPFCRGGYLEVGGKQIKFNRVHLEEDAGKLLHPAGSRFTIVDLNRAGTPLAEIVSEPDIDSPAQAKEFLKELQQIVRAIGVSDADMEKGHLRCDANISINDGNGKMSEIVEIKNLNSFKFVEKALSLEENRLKEKYPDWPEKVTKVTRGYDSKTGQTYILREKEEAKDYRYFPEPDIPPIDTEKLGIDEIRAQMKSLPSQKKDELLTLGLDEAQTKVVLKDSALSILLDEVAALDKTVVPVVAKIAINNHAVRKHSAEFLVSLANKIEQEKLPSNIVKHILESNSDEIGDTVSLPSDSSQIDEVVDQVISENSDAVEKIKAGKREVFGFLIGQVMAKTKGQSDPAIVRAKLEERIGE